MATILLCSDEPILAEGLSRVLDGANNLRLAGFCSHVEDLPALNVFHQPDIILIDLTAGITFGSLRALHELAPKAGIVLWAHTISTELALQAINLGVRGILRKTLTPEVLLRCLSQVGEGELWFDEALTSNLTSLQRYSLTRREGQLVSLLSQGLKNKEIALALNISEGTVKVYLSAMFQRLGVKDRFDLSLCTLRNLAPRGETLESRGDATDASSLQIPRTLFVERIPPRSEAAHRPLRQFHH